MLSFSLTPAAVAKLQQVLEQEARAFLRVSIRGGGCAGLEYQFEAVDDAQEWDLRFGPGDAQVLIDPISAPYLDGAQLDYESQLFGSRFVLHNPHAQTTCGCGKSFAG